MDYHNLQYSEWFINQKRIPDRDSEEHKEFFDFHKEVCMNGCTLDGVYFIDIEGKPTDGQEDMIKISVKPEYYTDEETGENRIYDTDPEYMVTESDYEEELPPISDEDINDLIN